MAAGAIPPPLFFERRRPCERKFCDITIVCRLAPAAPFLRDVFENQQRRSRASIAAGALTLRLQIERSLPKDI
jgi:hypothetical protein